MVMLWDLKLVRLTKQLILDGISGYFTVIESIDIFNDRTICIALTTTKLNITTALLFEIAAIFDDF